MYSRAANLRCSWISNRCWEWWRKWPTIARPCKRATWRTSHRSPPTSAMYRGKQTGHGHPLPDPDRPRFGLARDRLRGVGGSASQQSGVAGGKNGSHGFTFGGDGAGTPSSVVRHRKPWPWLPAILQRPIYDQLHGLAHPGVRASVRLVVERFVWHGLNRDVAVWARCCVACQRAKVHHHTDSGVEASPVPDNRF